MGRLRRVDTLVPVIKQLLDLVRYIDGSTASAEVLWEGTCAPLYGDGTIRLH